MVGDDVHGEMLGRIIQRQQALHRGGDHSILVVRRDGDREAGRGRPVFPVQRAGRANGCQRHRQQVGKRQEQENQQEDRECCH